MKQLIEFESLAAKKELDEESRFYLDTIDTTLQDENNKNIAITGGYGAGKTTIIDSYFEKNKSKADKMMRVSIATFQSDTRLNSSSSIDHNLLEQQILQQMFFQVNPNKILNSKFTKVSDLSFRYTFGILLYILFTTIFTILIVSNNWLNKFYSSAENIVDFLYSNWLWMLMVSIVIILNGLSLWLILIIFRKLGVSKFGVANTTIEFHFKDGSTVFNHYLDEIIYLFKKTNYKYIVFEDLDRFQDITIFERLRGLNTTLNRSAHIKDRDIKFIYALKDDVFKGEDETESIYNRTKFFDFIIPTVKVMHSSTAESILLDKLDIFISGTQRQEHVKNSNNQQISKLLIEDVALFINDMRTLNNICNEFEVFRLRLQKSSVTYDNLFAFIVYKNIYPSDYSNLLENKGLVFDVFNKKEIIVKALQSQMAKLKSKIKNGIGSMITEKKDIAMLFAKKIDLYNIQIKQDNIHLISTSYTNSKTYIRDGTRFLDYFLNEDIEGEFTFYRNDKAVSKYTNAEEFFTIDYVNYMDLYKSFDDRTNQTKEEIESQIDELSKKIQHVETKSVSRLIKEDSINLHVSLENKKLLYFLIRNNWLNETYEDYLTVFREGSMSMNDNKFIQSIKLGDTISNLHLQLKNKEKVAGKIRIDDISSIAALNLNLIITLLKNYTDINYDKLSKITQVLFRELEKHLEEFLILLGALKEESQTENLVWKFLYNSMQNGIDIWEVIGEATPSKEQKEEYVITFLEYSNIDELELMPESSNSLREFISYSLDLSKIPDSNNMYVLLEALKVKFTSLTSINEDSVLNNIVEINSYEINLINLRKIIGVENISIQNVKKDKHIFEYCFGVYELEIFIINVLLEQEVYNEEEEIFIEFTEQIFGGKYDIDKSIKQSIIQHWSGVITDISRIDSFELIKILSDEKKFKLTWENIMYCKEVFESKEEIFNINSLLSTEDYWRELIINSHEEVQVTFINNEQYHSFVNSILKLNPWSHPKIEEFISQLNYLVELQDISKIDNIVLEILIDHKVLSWNINIYNSIHSEQYKEYYVKENVNDAADEISELIEDGNLVWSTELFKLINESKEIEMGIKEKYLHDNLLNIEYREFKSILDNHNLEFNNEIIQILIKEPNKEDVLTLYLIQQCKSGSMTDVSNTIHKYGLPWNKELLKLILKDDVDVAANYLLNHIDKIVEVNINQELFDALIVKIYDNKIVIELIDNYQNDIEISQHSERIYEVLLTLNETDTLLSRLSQNTVQKIIETLPLESASELLFQFLVYKDLNKGEVFEFLSNLIEPFSLIKLKGGQIKITKAHTNIQNLLDYLTSKDLQVISSFNSSEQGYIVNNKRK